MAKIIILRRFNGLVKLLGLLAMPFYSLQIWLANQSVLQLLMITAGTLRHLMETVNLNLAHRWYIGYDLTETVPNHSSLSKIRERYGLKIFHRFFEHIIELCIQARLVWGEELYFRQHKGAGQRRHRCR